MSPTLSASSKAIIVSRKKVLGEENESVSSFDVQFQNPKKEGQLLLRPGTSEYSVRSSSSDEFSASDSTDEFNTSVADDSLSVKPYHPLTNYLSPRPKYLRYKPNRHREMLNRQWRHNRNEELMRNTVDSINSFEDLLDDPSNKATPSVPNQETVNDTGFDDDDEEEMEEEEAEEEEDDELEEKRCSLKGVLKFFLLLAVMGLCTSYKVSENSSRTSPMQLQGLKDGYYISLNHSLEEIPANLLCAGDGRIMCSLAREAQVGFPELLKNRQSSCEDLGKVQMVMEESGDDDDINVRMLDSLNDEQNSDSIINVTEVDKSDTILDHPVLNVEETADTKDLDMDQMGSDLPKQEDFAENNMILDDGEMDFMDNPGVTEQDSDMVQKPDDNTEENIMENAGEELNNSGLEGTADKVGDDKIVEAKPERPVIGEAWLKLMKARQVELGQIHIAPMAAFSIFAIVLASSSLVYCYIHHPRTPSKPVKTETEKLKPIQSHPQPYREIECLQKKLESISLKPSTMTFSLEELRKDVNYISQSPKVEFLGEEVIGGGKKKVSLCLRLSLSSSSSSTIKKCGKTNNEAEEEECSSNHPVTPTSDSASTDSPSYGSFTAEKKILMKKQVTKLFPFYFLPFGKGINE